MYAIWPVLTETSSIRLTAHYSDFGCEGMDTKMFLHHTGELIGRH
jgi:hypothetical protein